MAVNSVNNQKTIQQIIDSQSTSTSGRKTGELGKDDFLNLLVTQLRYQDPLKPVDDKEFIGQMAQFSALEQMQNMNSSMSQAQAYSLIGKHITATFTDDTTKKVSAVEGDVSSVRMNSGKAYVVVNGKDIPIANIQNVSEGSSIFNQSSIAQYTNLIGHNVKAVAYDPSSTNLISIKGNVSAILKGAYEDYAVMDGVEVEIGDIITNMPSTDPDFKKKYLEENIGKEVNIYIVDRANNQKVPVTAVLNSYTEKDGKLTGILDGFNVSVDSVMGIYPANAAT